MSRRSVARSPRGREEFPTPSNTRISDQSPYIDGFQQLSAREMISLLKKTAVGELETLHAIIDEPTIAKGCAHAEMNFSMTGAYSVKIDSLEDRNELFENIVDYLERIKQDNIDHRAKVVLEAGLCNNFDVPQNVTLPSRAPKLWLGKNRAKEDVDVFFRRHYKKYLKYGLTWKILENIDPKLKNAVRNFEKIYGRPWPDDLTIETTRSRLEDALKEVAQAEDLRRVPVEKLVAVTRKLAREGRMMPARPVVPDPALAKRRYPGSTRAHG